MRPIHWAKNLSIFAALIFSGLLWDPQSFWTVVVAFFAFSFAASSGYIINDIIDAPRDRLHPRKKNRPIAANKVPVPVALVVAGTLMILSLFIAYSLYNLFFWMLVAYLLLQFAYSLYLKNIQILDILIIATGFVIRVYSGAIVINAHLSVWFLLCVISAALFLASGKRRAELRNVEAPSDTRKSLSKYPKELLNSYVTMFGSAAWMSWALFTFFESPSAPQNIWLVLAEISRTVTVDKLLMITIPVTIFGIMRYENLIFEGRSEAPEKLLLTDKALISSVLIWIIMVIAILYGGFNPRALF
jgi:4-hydroxybenzoate polyprenyltransferase